MLCNMTWEDCDKQATRKYRRKTSDKVLTVCDEHAQHVRAMYRNSEYYSWEV
jgi:hypothetical protein